MNNSWPIPRPQEIQAPKAVFFDWDNTLVKSADATFQAYNSFLNRIGYPPLSREEANNRPPHSVRHWFPLTFGEEAPRMIELYYEELSKVHLQSLQPMDGCDDVLDYFAEQQIPMAVVSNKNGDILRTEIAHLGYDFYFTAAVGCFDTPHDKPNPEPLFEALRKSYLAPGLDVWYIGDNLIDYNCALNAGCYPIIVTKDSEQSPPFNLGYSTDHLKKILTLHQGLITS